MGAQYSTGTTSPEWKGWLEERCSLETVRSIYQNFRAGVSSTRDNDIDSDAFFITAEEFRRVFADVANYPSRGQRIHNNLERKHCSHPGDTEQDRRMHLDRCFSCFDVLERGRVPSGVVWGGLALLTGASELGKIKFVLGMYDANRDGQVNQTELRMAMAACATGFCRLHGIKPPPDDTLHSLAGEAFLHHAALEAALLARKAAERENSSSDDLTSSTNYTANPGIFEDSAISTSGTGAGVATSAGEQVVAKTISAGAVSAFCSANARCRNFLKGVGASGSADLVMLYQREHELLRELVHVDSALDDYERRSEGAAAEMKVYASERGGDVRQLVVGGARVHALAEKWRVGRLLDPLAIRALLNKARGDDAAGNDDGDDSVPPANERHDAPSSRGNDDGDDSVPPANERHDAPSSRGGNGTSWGNPLSPGRGVGGIGAGSGQDAGGSNAHRSGLGWVDNFASEPEIQMQALAEVGRFVRAAAARGGGHNGTQSGASSAEAVAAATAAATAARELEAQTKRRAARQAERERGVKERARKAADNLGSGGWKAFTLEDSVKYAKDYKLGIAKKANRGKTSGQEEVGGVRLAALARGGGGGSTLLSGKEMRSYRDWELLKDKQAIESEESSALPAAVRESKKDSRWTTPFSTRLDVDTLEDLVEGAGGFITDREAEEALTPEGELEKDQLGRVTLVGFVRWCRLREQRRVQAEARLRDPPPAWKQRLEHWRKVWKEDVIEELARAKRMFSRRNTRSRLSPPLNELPGDGRGSGHSSRNYSESSGGGGSTGSGGAAGGIKKHSSATVHERARHQRGGGSRHAAPAAEPRYSKFAASVVIPRPQQHDGTAAAIGNDPDEKKRGKNTRDGRSGNAGDKGDKGHKAAPLTSRSFSTSTNPTGRKITLPAGGEEHHTPSANNNGQSEPNAAAAFRSTIKLDIVKTDMERDGGGGGVASPFRSGGAGGDELGSGGGGAAAGAKSDSSASELLWWYVDEQKKVQAKFWQEEGIARKDREAQRKAASMPKRQRQEEEAEDGRRAAKLAPQVKEMGAVVWVDMPFLPASSPPPPPSDAVQQKHSNETSAAPPPTSRSAASQTAAQHADRGPPSIAPSSRKGSVGSGSSSVLAALVAERDAAADFEAAEESAAERVAGEVRSFFNNIPRDYRNELGFTDVLVAIVQIRYRTAPSAPSAIALGARAAAPVKKPSQATGATPAVSTATRGPRRVLRVAFFSDRDPFEIPSGGNTGVKCENATAYHPLADLVSKLTVQLEMTADMGEILQVMKPWKNFKRRLYGPQEEELPEDSMDPRTYAREVLEEIQTLSDLLGQVPSISFDGLRPILAKNGLSEVGTLGELSSRAAKVLEGRIKAVAGGGVLSKFGEKAARILFRMADRNAIAVESTRGRSSPG